MKFIGFSGLRAYFSTAKFELTNTMSNTVDEQGNTKAYCGTFEWNDGTVSEMNNYFFEIDTIHTVAKETIEISDEIAGMPYLPGSGNVYNSWDIMMKETDGNLKELLNSYASEQNKATRDSLLDQILYSMTGSLTVDAASRGVNIDARQLAVLEKLYGTSFNAGSDPNAWAGPMLESLYGNVKKYYAGWLDMQTVEKDLFDAVSFKMNASGDAVLLDFDGVKSILQNRIGQDYEQGKSDLSIFVNAAYAIGFQEKNEFVDFCEFFISQSDDLALAIYSAGRNIQNGGSDRDVLYSQGYDEILVGGAGNDRLEAHGGNNVLSGGTGADELYGCKGASEYRWGEGANDGNVVYLWNRGDGNDTIINAVEINDASNAGSSTVNFGVGISKDSLQFRQYGDSLQIIDKITGEMIKIQNWFVDDDYKIDVIQFVNGERLSRDEIVDLISFGGTDGDDVLVGGDYLDDIFVGKGGNDTLYGYAGNDVLDGGTGADYLEGGLGNDTYLWGKGDGNDTINNVMKYGSYGDPIEGGADTVQIKEGLKAADLAWKQEAENLIATIKETGETLTFTNWYASALNQVDSVKFADGTILTAEQLDELAAVMKGTDGDDRMIGSNTRGDIFDSGAGNDYMEGKGGDDTYLWGRGDGNDTINNVILKYGGYGDPIEGGADVVQIKEGLKAEDLAWKKDGNHLIATIKETGETLTFTDWFKNQLNPVDRIQFADGTILAPAQINAMTEILRGAAADDILRGGDMQDDRIYGEAGDDKLYGNGGDDALYGGLGNDSLYGNDGVDGLYGDAGNDSLYGGNGNDILSGGAGDDYLEGNGGADTYLWRKGDGNDVISAYEPVSKIGLDTVQFGEGVAMDALEYLINGNNLIFKNKETGETLTIKDYYRNTDYQMDQAAFADGTSLDIAGIDQKVRMIQEAALEMYEPLATENVNTYQQDQSLGVIVTGANETQAKKIS